MGVRWAVISYGERNSYGHPHQEVLDRFHERGVKIYETAKGGAVTLKTDGKMVQAVLKAFLLVDAFKIH